MNAYYKCRRDNITRVVGKLIWQHFKLAGWLVSLGNCQII